MAAVTAPLANLPPVIRETVPPTVAAIAVRAQDCLGTPVMVAESSHHRLGSAPPPGTRDRTDLPATPPVYASGQPVRQHVPGATGLEKSGLRCELAPYRNERRRADAAEQRASTQDPVAIPAGDEPEGKRILPGRKSQPRHPRYRQ